MKTCPGCKKELDLSNFHGNKARHDGKAVYCKGCRVYADRNIQLKMKYGIDLSEYEKMFVSQKGVCAICKNPETRISYSGKLQVLSVDHDHETGMVRELLCDSCNTGLAKFKENRQYMLNAVEYLERHSVENLLITQ